MSDKEEDNGPTHMNVKMWADATNHIYVELPHIVEANGKYYWPFRTEEAQAVIEAISMCVNRRTFNMTAAFTVEFDKNWFANVINPNQGEQ